MLEEITRKTCTRCKTEWNSSYLNEDQVCILCEDAELHPEDYPDQNEESDG